MSLINSFQSIYETHKNFGRFTYDKVQDLLLSQLSVFTETHGYELTKLCQLSKLKKPFESNRIYLENWEELLKQEIAYRQELQISLANKTKDNLKNKELIRMM